MQRRELLQLLATTAGLSWLDGLAPEQLLAFGRHMHARAATAGTSVLDAHANDTVIAAAECIIPATDTPGATDAAVQLFIDRMLADWYSTAERDRFLAGLRRLDEDSRTRYGRDFRACAVAEQTVLLTELDDEVTALRGPAAAQRRTALGISNANEHWFAMLKYLTVYGYFTSEVAARQTLRTYPLPMRYDGCAPYQPRARR